MSIARLFSAALTAAALLLSPLGNEAKGATRWISLGPVNLQPSEFAKLAWIVALGEHLGREVRLVPLRGARRVFGFNGKVMGGL